MQNLLNHDGHDEPIEKIVINRLPESWQLVKLGEVCTFTTGKLNSEQAVKGGKYPFFTCSPETFAIDSYSFDQEAILLAGNNARGIYSVKYYKGKFDAYQRTYVITVKEINKLNYYYLLYDLSLKLDLLRLQSLGATTKFLTASIIRNLILTLPPLPEQRAIAHTLRTIQKAREARQRELELERERKAALMQYLFNYGFVSPDKSISVPLQETKIGQIPEHWKVSQFDDVVDIVQGQIDPRVEPYKSMLHIGPENIESGTGKLLPTTTAAELGLISGKYLFSTNHILYSKIRPYLNKVALATFSGICSADMYPLLVKANLILREYLFYFLLSEQFVSQAISCQNRTGIPKINRKQLGSIILAVPPIEEQNLIANVLLACDRKITALEQEAAFLDELFRAMLEELMTGRLSALPIAEN